MNCLLFVLTSCYFSSKAIGQITEKDSIIFQASIKNALTVYHNFMPNPSGLYNGSQYISYAHLIKDNHPYFQSDSMNKGTITYDSVLFENVLLLYDIVKEQVVINDPYKIYKICLINEKVNEFSVLGRTFIRLIRDSLNRNILSTGFYDRLYQGSITLYEKEIKKLQEVIVSQELQRIIYPINNFYLEIGGKFYSINRKKTLLNLLQKNRRKEIQQFIRKNKLNYRRDKENTLLKVVKYYDELQGVGNKK
ncbi:MAG: hypothetical protein ABIN89_18570 [Chitinophagaceae bacterium]